jgi:hypothetical protein
MLPAMQVVDSGKYRGGFEDGAFESGCEKEHVEEFAVLEIVRQPDDEYGGNFLWGVAGIASDKTRIMTKS